MSTSRSLSERPLFEIARDISDDWKNMAFYARPYVEAMSKLRSLDDIYICDSASSIVAYFLSNAAQWRGPTARSVKAELNAMLRSAKR